MAAPDGPFTSFRTDEQGGVWFSLTPSLLPPDDTAAWFDLYRHQEGGMIVQQRCKGLAAAITWAWTRLGVEPAAWRPDPDAG